MSDISNNNKKFAIDIHKMHEEEEKDQQGMRISAWSQTIISKT